MSISKKIRYALLGLTCAIMILACTTSLFFFSDIKSSFNQENNKSVNTLYHKNVSEITSSSKELASSLSSYYAQTLNVDFERIQGELNTIAGDIESVNQGKGTVKKKNIRRYKEYIVSKKAKISPEEIARTVRRFNALTNMFDSVLHHEKNISLAYLVLQNGVVISSTDTFYPAVENTDMRQRKWYQDTLKGKDQIRWSDLYEGKTDGRKYVTCSKKIYDKNHKILGVVAFDLRVSEISEQVLNHKDNQYLSAFIMNKKGKILFSSQSAENVKKEKFFHPFIQSYRANKLTNGNYSDKSSIIGYSKIESSGWILVTVLDYHKMMKPVKSVATSIRSTGARLSKVISSHISGMVLIFIAISMGMILLTLAISQKMSKVLTKSIDDLVDGAVIIGQGNLDHVIELNTHDEMEMLAKTFNQMTLKLRDYIEEITRDASEKQRLASELDLAKSIQLGMLPKELEGDGYDISGMMVPAKEVGGDFYDFFEIGEDKVCFLVADVSGKGVGAALFMTISKTIIKTAASGNTNIEELLEVTNGLLCEQNPAELFVTVFVAIMDKNSGEIAYSCAAHNPPVLIRKDGTAEFIPVKHKLPLAAMEGMKYPTMKMKLLQGETLILYTDGVTEATNKNQELYGDDRLLKVATGCQHFVSDEIMKKVKQDVDQFVGDAPQFDDITISVIRR